MMRDMEGRGGEVVGRGGGAREGGKLLKFNL